MPMGAPETAEMPMLAKSSTRPTFGLYVFSRLYGYTLGRTYRNDPARACADAVTQFMIVLGVPGICAVIVFMAIFNPTLILTKEWIPLVTVPAGVVMFVVTRRYIQYADTPQIAQRFNSPASRRITLAMYFFTLLISVVITGFTMKLLRRH